MAQPRTPVPPRRKGEALLTSLVRDAENLKRARPFEMDARGRFRIGDVYITQTLLDDGQTIRVTLQNAITEGQAVPIGDLK